MLLKKRNNCRHHSFALIHPLSSLLSYMIMVILEKILVKKELAAN